MAFTEKSHQGEILNTEKILVDPPDVSTRRLVRLIVINNRDTATNVVIVSKKIDPSGTSDTELFRICRVELESGETLIISDVFILEAVNESIVATLESAITTSNFEFNSSYADVTS